MSDEDAARGQVTASAAEIYDEFFVPALFGQWTDIVLDRAGVGAGDRVLDVGCGTGVVARAAAARVGAAGAVDGVDRNAGMLAVARRAPEPITWHEGVAERLPIPDASMDAALCQFVLMFVDDAPSVARELRRVLRPGGRAVVATWASVDESPGYAAMVDVIRDVAGESAADALLAPFRVGTPEQLRSLLTDAFADAEVERVVGTARFPSIEEWVRTDIRGWTLSDMIDDATYGALLAAATERLASYADATGAVAFPVTALIATGVRPA